MDPSPSLYFRFLKYRVCVSDPGSYGTENRRPTQVGGRGALPVRVALAVIPGIKKVIAIALYLKNCNPTWLAKPILIVAC